MSKAINMAWYQAKACTGCIDILEYSCIVKYQNVLWQTAYWRLCYDTSQLIEKEYMRTIIMLMMCVCAPLAYADPYVYLLNYGEVHTVENQAFWGWELSERRSVSLKGNMMREAQAIYYPRSDSYVSRTITKELERLYSKGNSFQYTNAYEYWVFKSGETRSNDLDVPYGTVSVYGSVGTKTFMNWGARHKKITSGTWRYGSTIEDDPFVIKFIFSVNGTTNRVEYVFYIRPGDAKSFTPSLEYAEQQSGMEVKYLEFVRTEFHLPGGFSIPKSGIANTKAIITRKARKEDA
jgi:hypothetical protein